MGFRLRAAPIRGIALAEPPGRKRPEWPPPGSRLCRDPFVRLSYAGGM
jgi:hypothetical protein